MFQTGFGHCHICHCRRALRFGGMAGQVIVLLLGCVDLGIGHINGRLHFQHLAGRECNIGLGNG